MTLRLKSLEDNIKRGKTRSNQAGQTLIIAILILGILIIIGLVFAGLVSRTINTTQRSLQRTLSTDLAEAGIRYAHHQLIYSDLGADWRPAYDPNILAAVGNFTRDPDALYLRPGSGFPLRGAADPLIDRGGPDGLGPYTRVNYDKGRVLVRVRYAPTDVNVYSEIPGIGVDASGPLRQPGRARYYTIIEAVGRPGLYRAGDPTLQGESVQFRGYAGDQLLFRTELGKMKKVDSALGLTSRKLMAFASIGIIESGRFITNKHKSSRVAELGVPSTPGGIAHEENSGVLFRDLLTATLAPVDIVMRMGGSLPVNLPAAGDLYQGGGSLYSNASLQLNGKFEVALNDSIGDVWAVNGSIKGANDTARLEVARRNDTTTGDNCNFTLYNDASISTPSGVSLNSRDSQFSTLFGLIRDGKPGIDNIQANGPDPCQNVDPGYTRGVARKEPPSILTLDPATRTNRYMRMTRESGRIEVNARTGENENIGRYGLGRGVYVDTSDRVVPSADQRAIQGSEASIFEEWLNPSLDRPNWKGPFYIPGGASHVQLVPDGFIITRASSDPEKLYWRNTDGTSTGRTQIRFRLGRFVAGGPVYIIDEIQSGGLVNVPMNAGALEPEFTTSANGREFNGVLVFEGDVRVRGVIPTDVPLTIVSMASIFVEGSITKGIVTSSCSDVFPRTVPVETIDRPSRSTLMLMAKDYAVLNTTMFFGPAPTERLQGAESNPVPDAPLSVKIPSQGDVEHELRLASHFLLDPQSGTPTVPSTWLPYATSYSSFNDPATLMPPSLLVTQAGYNGVGGLSDAGLSAKVTPRTFADPSAPPEALLTYFFPKDLDFATAGTVPINGFADLFPAVLASAYGLNDVRRNSYPLFESLALPLLGAQTWNLVDRKLVPDALVDVGEYHVSLQDEARVTLRAENIPGRTRGDYALARFAAAPHDIRIEAALFAEEGSFFVIPGPWFNYNPNDTRELHMTRVDTLGADLANRRRFEEFRTHPQTPFYGEPLDVRVTIIGAISENMPAPVSAQTEWMKKWGWIPRTIGGTNTNIPAQHVPDLLFDPGTPDRANYMNDAKPYAPNLLMNYDPVLALASPDGDTPIRFIKYDTDPALTKNIFVLPPMPRLPVSPSLSYFGDIKP